MVPRILLLEAFASIFSSACANILPKCPESKAPATTPNFMSRSYEGDYPLRAAQQRPSEGKISTQLKNKKFSNSTAVCNESRTKKTARADERGSVYKEVAWASDVSSKMADAVSRCTRVEHISGRASQRVNSADVTAATEDSRGRWSPTNVMNIDSDESNDFYRQDNKFTKNGELSLHAIRSRIVQLNRTVKSQEEVLQSLRSKNAALLGERRAAIVDRERIRAECREVLTRESNVANGLREELRKREEELEALQNRLYDFRLRTAKNTNCARTELKSLHKALDDVRNEKNKACEVLTSEIDLLKSEKSLAKHEIKTTNARLISEISSIRQDLTVQTAKYAASSAARIALRSQVAQILAQNESLESMLSEKLVELENEKSQSIALRDELDAQRSEHGKIAVELMETNDEFRDLQTKMRAAREMYEAASGVISQELKLTQVQFRELSAEHYALRARADALENESIQTAQAQYRLVIAGARLADSKNRAPHLRISRALRPGRPSLLSERRSRRRQASVAESDLKVQGGPLDGKESGKRCGKEGHG